MVSPLFLLKTQFAHQGKIRLDLSGVTRVNSVGLRSWLEAARDGTSDRHVIYERCSLAMVRQINLIPTLLDQGTVASFLAPYVCPTCKLETVELLTPQQVRDSGAPAVTCPQCMHELVLDAPADEYFAFLGTH